MKIAVCGGWIAEEGGDGLRTRDSFARACRQIGRTIAQTGQTLVVGGDSDGTADRYAVEGMTEVLSGSQLESPRIIILRPNDQRVPFEEARNENQGLFTAPFSINSEWDITKILQVNEADAVVVVGGAERAYQAGLAAVLCKKPMVAVGSFGGAAKKLLTVLANSRDRWPGDLPSSRDLQHLHEPWNESVLATTKRLLGLDDAKTPEGARKPRVLIIHGRSNDREKLQIFLQNTLELPAPVIMADQFVPGAVLPEKFETLANECDCAIALATPDDVGGLASKDQGAAPQLELRARQNIWLEVGWFWGRLGRQRILLLCQDHDGRELEIPSDLNGLDHRRYAANPIERAEVIRMFIDQLSGTLSLKRASAATG